MIAGELGDADAHGETWLALQGLEQLLPVLECSVVLSARLEDLDQRLVRRLVAGIQLERLLEVLLSALRLAKAAVDRSDLPVDLDDFRDRSNHPDGG